MDETRRAGAEGNRSDSDFREPEANRRILGVWTPPGLDTNRGVNLYFPARFRLVLRTPSTKNIPHGLVAPHARYFCAFLSQESRLPAVYNAMRGAQTNGEVSAAHVLQRVTGSSLKQLEARWLAVLHVGGTFTAR